MKLLSKIALGIFTLGSLVSCGVYSDGYGYNDGYYNRSPYYDGGYYMNNVYYSGPNYNYYGPGGYWGNDGYYYRRGVSYYYDNGRPYFYNNNRRKIYVEKELFPEETKIIISEITTDIIIPGITEIREMVSETIIKVTTITEETITASRIITTTISHVLKHVLTIMVTDSVVLHRTPIIRVPITTTIVVTDSVMPQEDNLNNFYIKNSRKLRLFLFKLFTNFAWLIWQSCCLYYYSIYGILQISGNRK